MNYHNENDPYAAQWLQNLIDAGEIPPGHVDTRSIEDVTPYDLSGYTQCHFFAGIGGWPLALRLAGWPEDRPVWTGSCPCQPFSAAGKGGGAADPRHLWPVWYWLIKQCRPPEIMGEQVAAAVGKDWLDGVCSDLEGIGYACAAGVVPACAVDAPHRRERLWFVANSDSQRGKARISGSITRNEGYSGIADDRCRESVVADSNESCTGEERQQRSRKLGGPGGNSETRSCAVGDTNSGRSQTRPHNSTAGQRYSVASDGRQSAWSGAGWIIGHDGKARRVEPGIRLLVDGVSGRVPVQRTDEQTGATIQHWYNRAGALKAFGNAIVPQVAAEVIAAFMECRP